ncbi:MAG: hypothetical protein K6F82_06245 [Sphaerochaetaceae bacterium]|nr:hypothetical protein [Sphaerochaetaceae bacterium]
MFIFKTAFRYAFSKTGGRRRTAIMQILGIGAGIIALMIVSAVMNGLQDAQIRHLRNIESYDLTVISDTLTIDDLRAIDANSSVYETCETAALIVDKNYGNSATARVRGISENLVNDPRFSESLVFYTDYSSLSDKGAFSLALINSLGLSAEDEIDFTFLRPGKTATIVPFTYESGIGGLYASYITDYSSSTVLMDINALLEINPKTQIIYAVYTNLNTASFARSVLELDENAQVVTWQEYNRALYSALTLEKTVMYIFLGFMFLILCVNLRNTTKRLIRTKLNEGAMLRALGCTKKSLNSVFVLQALIICILGEIFGVVSGILAVSNIDKILSLVDKIIFILTSRQSILTAIPFAASIGAKEIIFICAGVLLMTYILILFGCRKAFKKEIMEVMANVPD